MVNLNLFYLNQNILDFETSDTKHWAWAYNLHTRAISLSFILTIYFMLYQKIIYLVKQLISEFNLPVLLNNNIQ